MSGQPAGQPSHQHHPRVLVTAASKYGATAGIAEAIADELIAHGVHATVLPPGKVIGVEEYDAVILGSAVYTGHWQQPAKDLVGRCHEALLTRPVWLFSSGPVGDPGRKLVQSMGQDPADLPEIQAATHARGHKMFAGKLDPKTLGLAQRASLLLFRGLAGDFRDWAAIREWAAGIADELAPLATR